ncbi:NIPSNAP family protein [Specibacter sp. RAF43]|uniref:NIPSNAP family protein n=1 Tax=Specibacter sp. RAF43 TaxID=3233057 RepID=UPI003F95A9F3
MIYELRHYVACPGKAEQLEERFRVATLPLFQKHNMHLVNLWRESGNEDEFWYLLRFRSPEQRDDAWKAFGKDPEWQSAKAAFEAHGPLVSHQESRLLLAANTTSGDVHP